MKACNTKVFFSLVQDPNPRQPRKHDNSNLHAFRELVTVRYQKCIHICMHWWM